MVYSIWGEASTDPDVQKALVETGRERAIIAAIEEDLGIKVEKIRFPMDNTSELTICFGGGNVTIDLADKPEGMFNEDFIVETIDNVIKENRS